MHNLSITSLENSFLSSFFFHLPFSLISSLLLFEFFLFICIHNLALQIPIRQTMGIQSGILLEMHNPQRCNRIPRPEPRDFSGDIVLFLPSKPRRLEARNFAVILICIPFNTYEKTSFTEWAGRSFTNGFAGPKSLRDFRETGPWSLQSILRESYLSWHSCNDNVVTHLNNVTLSVASCSSICSSCIPWNKSSSVVSLICVPRSSS